MLNLIIVGNHNISLQVYNYQYDGGKNMKEKIFDYRGDCWKGYQDVGLCLRILPPGKSFSFIIEKEKVERIKQVIDHHQGQINSEKIFGNDIKIDVQKKVS